MTDFTNRNVVYYNVFQYNNTSSNVPCAINQPLSFNLVDKSNDYYLGIVKAKFDLSAFTAPVGNALDKVLIQSQSFNVINSFYGNVLQNQIIMDVDYPQTSTDTVWTFLKT